MKSLQALAPDWQALSALLDEALALPPEDRAAWLERLGPEAEGLRPRLRELLELQEDVRTRGFLESLPVLPGLPAPALAVRVGDQVGPYRLVDEIGRGGMGSVWLAERADGLLKRRCALKLPLLAWSDSLRDRMAQERDILASLDHPHIARLLDTGVDDQGRPFLALEHVQGEPIDAWMDARKLPVRERVAIFVQVVDAIRYAHVNLVIHRDLKPSNILVTAQGQAKLLDFGIAKLLSDAQAAGDAPDLTRTGQRLLTPRYASPEQILGQRLTAASDVYSLGVLLHELLCGQPPYAAGKAADKVPEQVVLEADVRAPSRRGADAEAAARRGTTPDRLARQLRGELDAIVLRALARAQQDRYPSAEALQADLQAWLEGRPVQARNPGALAVAWKFVRRHRWPVGIGATGLLATVVMGLLAASQAWRSDAEARRAEAARDFLSDMLKGADPSLRQGRQLVQREFLEQAESTIEVKYARRPELREKFYKEVADLWAEFGDHARRAAALEKRSAALMAIGDTAELSTNLLEQARVTIDLLRDPDRAEGQLDRFKALAQVRPLPAELMFAHDLWRGWLETHRFRFDAALAAFESAGALARNLGSPYLQAQALSGRSHAQHRLTRWDEADRSLRELLSLSRQSDPAMTWQPADLRAIRWELTQEMLRRGLYREGWPEVEDLMRTDERERGRFSASAFAERLWWLRWCIKLRREQDAAAWLEDRERSIPKSEMPPPDTEWLLAEAQVFSLMGQAAKASELLANARRASEALPAGKIRQAQENRIAVVRARLALAGGDQHELDEAVKAIVNARMQPGSDDSTQRWLAAMQAQFAALAEALRGARTGSFTAAGATATVVTDMESWLGPRHPDVIAVKLNLALQRWGANPRAEDAREAASHARALVDLLPGQHPAAVASARVLGDLEAWTGAEPPARPAKTLLRRATQTLILL